MADFMDAIDGVEKAAKWGAGKGEQLDNYFHFSDRIAGVTPEALERTHYKQTGVVDQRVRGEAGMAEAAERKKQWDGETAMNVHQNHFLPEAREATFEAEQAGLVATNPMDAMRHAMHHWTE